MSIAPRPRPTPTTQHYWDALGEGRLELQRCAECTRLVHYPRHRCPHCGSATLLWEEADPHGRLHSFTIARQPTAPTFAGMVPQLIAIIELDNGIRMTANLVDSPIDQLRVGLPVVGVFVAGDDGRTLLQFRLADDSTANQTADHS